MARGHGNTLVPAARKKPFIKTVSVEMGGGVNFFELPSDSRRYVIPNQDRYSRTKIHGIIREPDHPNQNRSGPDAVSAHGDLSLIHRKKRQPWTDDFTKRELERSYDPLKRSHEVPPPKASQNEERKRHFHSVLESQRGGANPPAGLPAHRTHPAHPNQRETWNFLRHDIVPTVHMGQHETGAWVGKREVPLGQTRPTTAPACNARGFSTGHCGDTRSDRLGKYSSTGLNLLAGDINQFNHGWSKNNNRGQCHESP